ncbi:MAG: hypothetical protein JNL60_10300 [Bacteroidia bacterium]|nr:hypothetical protein [Bacteroidia bacterium]
MFKKFTFSFFAFLHFYATAQSADSSMMVFRQAEQELSQLQQKAFFSRKESDRIQGNKEFLAVWARIIPNPKIMDYSFTSLKEISILSPKDEKFKLITWNLQRDDGTHAFFGFLLVNNRKRIKKGLFKYENKDEYEYFLLIDRSATVKSPETYVGSADKWFGMLYTQLVECDGFYTLIGWDGNDKLTQRKFIDVLYFKSNGVPVFGKDVFKFPKKNPKRLMFECAQEVNMSVKYNEKRNQIVYSHLAPRQVGTLLEGQFQYYGPDGSFDALELKRDRWVLIENIDINSGIEPLKDSKKPDPKKQQPVYKPK